MPARPFFRTRQTAFLFRTACTGAVLALGVLAGPGRAAEPAADYDLCVRGTTLDETHNLHLKLHVEGADVAAFAPRLGAALANRRFWEHRAQQVYGVPFDPDLCGDEVAEEQSISVHLTDEQAHALEAEATRGMDDGLLSAVDRVLGKDIAARSLPGEAGNPGEQVKDADGKLLYRLMRVYYATNRKETTRSNPDEHFGGDRGAGLSYGSVNVTIPRTHKRGGLESPSILRLQFRADPTKHVMLQSVRALDVDAWRAEIGKRAAGVNNPGILVFVHGFNTSFADAARRAGQLAYDLNFSGATVVFSWPSRAEVVEYTVDEQNAEWSIPDMETVLESLSTVAPGTPIYLIAHSMGNRVLTRGYKELLVAKPASWRAFGQGQIVLAAPDVDAEVFKRDIAPTILTGRGPRITLYASSNDKALMASRFVHGEYRRLGESGKSIVVMHNLDTVDASTVSTEFLGHGYFADSETVVGDLQHLIHERLKPQERERFFLEPVQDEAIGLYWRFKGRAPGT
jgi:esterase/lipase superfamily enzyme